MGATTLEDADGREWVLVPKDGDWNMTKAALALIASSNINTGDLTIGTLAAAFENAIAAAPQFVPPAAAQGVEMTDLSQESPLWREWAESRHSVQQIREELDSPYTPRSIIKRIIPR